MATQSNWGMYFKNDSGGTLTLGTVGSLSGVTSTSSSSVVGINTADDLAVNQPIGSALTPLNHVGFASIDGSVSQTAAGTIQATSLTILAESNIQFDQLNSVSNIAFHTDSQGVIEFNNASSSLSSSQPGVDSQCWSGGRHHLGQCVHDGRYFEHRRPCPQLFHPTGRRRTTRCCRVNLRQWRHRTVLRWSGHSGEDRS